MHYTPRMNLLANKIILVTGSSSGIGREAALTYARYGAEIILLGRNKGKLKNVCDEIHLLSKKKRPAPSYYDIDFQETNPQNYLNLAQKISSHYSRIDGILHNASMLGEIKPISQQNPIIWHQVMNVNIYATFLLTQALMPLLLCSLSGSLILTSSSVGRKGRSGWGAYCVSKFATEGFMQVLADEHKNTHLRINCINPGPIKTKMRACAFPQENAEILPTPADIMPIYLYLMGEDSVHENGVSFDAQKPLIRTSSGSE
ncbi:MAG: YciK family oxidoreductase [Candidatus Dasytiphilus stammeri]